MLGETKSVRREARRSATRREIVDAAWQVARERGLGDVRLKDVAEIVGMQPPSLYSHFSSKNAIYDAMFEDAWTAFLEHSRALQAQEPADDREALRFYARVFFDFAVADPARHQLMNLRTIPGFTPSPEAYAPSVTVMSEFMERMARRGISGQDDIDLFVAVVSGLVDAQIANDPGGTRWARLLDRAIDMYAEGFGVPHERSRT